MWVKHNSVNSLKVFLFFFCQRQDKKTSLYSPGWSCSSCWDYRCKPLFLRAKHFKCITVHIEIWGQPIFNNLALHYIPSIIILLYHISYEPPKKISVLLIHFGDILCVCTCTFTCGCGCTRAHVEARGQPQVLLLNSNPLLFTIQIGSLTRTWGLLIRLGWLPRRPQGSNCLHLLHAGITNT